MSLLKVDPLKNYFSVLSRDDFFAPFEHTLDALFNNMMKEFPDAVKASTGYRQYPKTDVYRKGNDLIFESFIPFLNKENLSVQVKNDILFLCGDCVKDAEFESRGYFLKELKRSKFARTWNLPREVIEKNPEISAEFKDGVLLILFKDAYKDKELSDEENIKVIEIK